ncbi:MAG TPA: peptide chain release factor N(5)-glutamine methyltransferase [Rhizomicrobium sp.]|nr:peptide chain release factor N(5)-glutamine methyltransferase [Rhizomicrobium sp.]
MTLDEATQLLAQAGIDNPRAEARLLLAHALGVSREQTLAAMPTPQQSAKFDALIARRTVREPFAYITGHKEFWSLDFEVGAGVLVPRPDTETLIEEALRIVPDRSAVLRIADLGTGSGAILIAALKEFPNAGGIGFESSPQAFACARANAVRLIGERAQIRLADWEEAQGPFDLVFSNPPYIPSGDIESLEPEVSQFEPRTALDGGPDGLGAYRALARLLPRLLSPGGHALLEIGQGQAQPMGTLFQGLELLRLAPDLSGIPRCVILRKP